MYMKQLVCRECDIPFTKKNKSGKDPKYCGTDCYMVTLRRKAPKEELISVDASCDESSAMKYLLIIIFLIVAIGIFVVILGK
jgi:hypothetical protein